MANEFPDIPRNMRKVQRRFEQWRSAHTGRLPIPQRLWMAATELARRHGVFGAAKALHLEYGKVKRLLGEMGSASKRRVKKAPLSRARRARSTPPPAFVELIGPRPSSSHECRMELEGLRGRMRFELKGIATAELVALSVGAKFEHMPGVEPSGLKFPHPGLISFGRFPGSITKRRRP